MDNLSNEKQLEQDIKQKIYNIVKKMPKKLFIDENITKFGQKEKIEDLKEIYKTADSLIFGILLISYYN